jgi:hypothetical protein
MTDAASDSRNRKTPLRARRRRTVLAGLLVALLAALPGIVGAADVAVEGVGFAAYRGDAPDAAARAAALHSAKVNLVETYVARLSETVHPMPVPYRDYFYLSFHPELQNTLDQYLSDIVVLDESTDKARKLYQVRIRATLNEEQFNRILPFPQAPR